MRSPFLTLSLFLLLLTACGPKPLAEVKIPFTGESVMADIDGEPYRFFRYDTVDAAQADRAKISADGKTIDGKTMAWEGPVHIFFLNKRIVIYVGSDAKTLATIEQVFGPKIAGD